MDHLIFLLIITVPLALILWYDRKNMRAYLGIGILAIILDSVWDPIAMTFDLWYYGTYPQFLGVSVCTLLLYIHYLAFCYFFGNMLARRLEKWR